jgi:PIN domain nuclease of toxin-antitoxin system
MKYLLDTHTALWALAGQENLSTKCTEILGDTSQSLAVSIVSIWEVAIKINIGKLKLAHGIKGFIGMLEDACTEICPITARSLICYESLPLIHRDPFDRLLVATAITESMVVLTADRNIARYDVSCLW